LKTVLAIILYPLLQFYLLVLVVRVVLSWVPLIKPSWTPKGIVLVLVEGVYFLTDPPLKLLRTFIKPLRFGGIALDLAMLVLFLLVQVLFWGVAYLR
jgi:transmembrane protein